MTEKSRELLTPKILQLAGVLAAKHAPWGSQEHEDLTSDGHLLLVEAAKRFDPARGVKFITYAYRCVMMGLLNKKRPGVWGRKKLLRLDMPNEEGVPLAEMVPAREETVLPDHRDMLEAIMFGIPPTHRVVFTLRAGSGEGWEKISALVSLPPKQVRSIYRSVTRRLKLNAERHGTVLRRRRTRTVSAPEVPPDLTTDIYAVHEGARTITGPSEGLALAMRRLGQDPPSTRGGYKGNRDALGDCNTFLRMVLPGVRLARGPEALELFRAGYRFEYQTRREYPHKGVA